MPKFSSRHRFSIWPNPDRSFASNVERQVSGNEFRESKDRTRWILLKNCLS